MKRGFPGASDGKESACNAEDPSPIPGLGRSSAGENGNPLRYSCLENPWTEEPGRLYSPWGCKESEATEQAHTLAHLIVYKLTILPAKLH